MRVAVAVVTKGSSEQSRLVAFDLRDGHVAWQAELEESIGASYFASQGRLLRTDGTTVTRLG